MRPFLLLAAFLTLTAASGPALSQTDSTVYYRAADSVLRGPLISSSSSMETAWDLVLDPNRDSIAGGADRAALVRRGFAIFTQTPKYAPMFTGNAMACGHCHLNAGQREGALPLVGVANAFPEFNRRAGREFTLVDRITGCFLRSMNGAGAPVMLAAHKVGGNGGRGPESGASADSGGPGAVSRLIAGSDEVEALAAYLGWLSEGYPRGSDLSWRGRNRIADSSLVDVELIDTARGRELYAEQCVTCHGEDGQGVEIGDIRPGPLWGPGSWNDGAGAARVYTLAGMVRHMMPYLDPGSLTDREALEIAAFICSLPRPAYPFKAYDYVTEPLPPDAVYYRKGR